ncbi:MAG: nucleoside-diphosphate kinase [[Pasteurella] mairii]|uniref:Nucleoside diphosphate kinase n=1 Tax=[Pasteurella] mairii TaxID=757 RepID=A0A379B391_9PAST|nr:nucleoside-diphosphate kinase [[Pasteurella] mairii]SUB32769.1 nucleoside diphosphate kinase [[Pasteurella] mairii]
MALEQTLSIIKPDAVQRNLIGQILAKLESNGFTVVAAKMLRLTQPQAEGFYAEHEGKPFFVDLVKYMTSAPVVVAVLEKENAVKDYRTLMGTTDPETAAEGTLRREFALSKQQNAVHGSDSVESAKREIAYYFADSEICAR